MADPKATTDAKKNCPSCKKPLNRKNWYYREGAYYCNKNCFQKKLEGATQAAQEGAAVKSHESTVEKRKDLRWGAAQVTTRLRF